MHLADLSLFVDIGSKKLESQHIDYILLFNHQKDSDLIQL